MKSQDVSKSAADMAKNLASGRRRVFVGLSGGVDSAVSAALLKKDGYDVTGVFIKVWQPDWMECNWKEERLEAMRVAAHLEIPFVTLDLVQEYKKDVIDYMISEYAAGRTPNPDVMCNRYVKFGAFWRWAKEHGADFVATGHYVRIAAASNVGENHNGEKTAFKLLAGIDTNKDQSYFLWTLNQNDLGHILFPVGHLTKPEVRKLAKKFKLPNAEKKDSQGLCFIGKVDVKEFLAHYIQAKPGNVLDEKGEIVGKHPGALLFTIGERHGFTVEKKTPNDKPYFVVDKDVERNTVTVSNRTASDSLPGAQKRVRIIKVNWVSGNVPEAVNNEPDFQLQARSRYRQPLSNIRVVKSRIVETDLEFEMPQDALTSGQSLVVYDGDACLGGGVIE